MNRTAWGLGWAIAALCVGGARADESWRERAPWHADRDAALEDAAAQDRVVFAFFTRPGCPPCAALHAGLFSSDEFTAAADAAVLWAAPSDAGQPGRRWLTRLGGTKTPFLAFLTPTGELIAPYTGGHTAAAWQRAALAAQTLHDAAATPPTNDDAHAEHLLAEVCLGLEDPEPARARLDALEGLDPERRAEVRAEIDDEDVLRLWYEAQPRTPRERVELGRRFTERFHAGVRPARPEAAEAYYLLILEACERDRAPDEFAAALDALRAWIVARDGDPSVLRPYAQRLEQLRAR